GPMNPVPPRMSTLSGFAFAKAESTNVASVAPPRTLSASRRFNCMAPPRDCWVARIASGVSRAHDFLVAVRINLGDHLAAVVAPENGACDRGIGRIEEGIGPDGLQERRRMAGCLLAEILTGHGDLGLELRGEGVCAHVLRELRGR